MCSTGKREKLMSKISVIIPCYNAEKYIKKCFDGLEKQIFKEFDVIVIDDFSTDNCITVCVAGRNLEKMHKRYESWKDNNLKIFKYDVLKAIIFDYEVDYVIHAAGNAHPLAFNSDPVGTIIGNIEGTYNLLEYVVQPIT